MLTVPREFRAKCFEAMRTFFHNNKWPISDTHTIRTRHRPKTTFEMDKYCFRRKYENHFRNNCMRTKIVYLMKVLCWDSHYNIRNVAKNICTPDERALHTHTLHCRIHEQCHFKLKLFVKFKTKRKISRTKTKCDMERKELEANRMRNNKCKVSSRRDDVSHMHVQNSIRRFYLLQYLELRFPFAVVFSDVFFFSNALRSFFLYFRQKSTKFPN